MKLPPITTPDGRRAYAFVAIWIGCIVFTIFAAVAVWLVSGNARYSLILGLAAHLQLLVGMGAFSFILGRRMSLKAGKDGVTLDDNAIQEAADQVAAAAVSEAETIKETTP